MLYKNCALLHKHYLSLFFQYNQINHSLLSCLPSIVQETHQQIADRKGLHVVEFRKECGPLPIVVASPEKAQLLEDVEEEPWDKELPLEWKEERPRKTNSFSREGTIFF